MNRHAGTVVSRVKRDGHDIYVHSLGGIKVDVEELHVGDINHGIARELEAKVIEVFEFVSLVAATVFDRCDCRLAPAAYKHAGNDRSIRAAVKTFHIAGSLTRRRSCGHTATGRFFPHIEVVEIESLAVAAVELELAKFAEIDVGEFGKGDVERVPFAALEVAFRSVLIVGGEKRDGHDVDVHSLGGIEIDVEILHVGSIYKRVAGELESEIVEVVKFISIVIAAFHDR